MSQDKTITKVSPPFQDKLLNPETGYMSRPWELYFLRLPLTLTGYKNQLDIHESYIGSLEGRVGAVESGPLKGGASDVGSLSDVAGREGTSTLLARADHTHQRSIQVESDGTDLVDVAVLDAGSNMSVEVGPDLIGSLLTDLFAYWPLDEDGGSSRLKKIGDAASATLVETIGAVSSDAGLFNQAIESTYASTNFLRSSCTPVSLSTGFTFACWFTSVSENAGGGSHIYQNLVELIDRPSGNLIRIARHRTVGGVSAGWMTIATQIGGDTNETADVENLLIQTRNDWHFVVGWWDPVTTKLYLQVDNQPVVESTLGDGVSDLSSFTLNEVNLAIPDTWDAWDGKIDAPMIWTRKLTTSEIGRVRTVRRASMLNLWEAMLWQRVFGG